MAMKDDGLAKLLEEMGELSTAVAKKQAYYHTDIHPDGGPPLSERMEDETGDVLAACQFVIENFGLDAARIEARRLEKLAIYKRWHADPDN